MLDQRQSFYTWRRCGAMSPDSGGPSSTTLDAAFSSLCAPSVRAELPSELKAPLATLSKKVASQRRLNANGNVARSMRQTSCYFHLAKRWLAQSQKQLTACEIGFNVGHSASVFLTALGPSSRYVGFELSEASRMFPKQRRLVTAALAVLNGSAGLFPGRIDLVYGNSLQSAPRFLASHPNFRCDLLSIDGDHTLEYVFGDWRNFKSRLNPERHLILFDDINHHHPIFAARRFRDPALHLIGCMRLSGMADDDESLALYKLLKARGKNVTRPLIASDAFCVARHSTAADLRVPRWAVEKTQGDDEAMYRRIPRDEMAAARRYYSMMATKPIAALGVISASTPKGFARRAAARDTWMRLSTDNIAVRFVLRCGNLSDTARKELEGPYNDVVCINTISAEEGRLRGPILALRVVVGARTHPLPTNPICMQSGCGCLPSSAPTYPFIYNRYSPPLERHEHATPIMGTLPSSASSTEQVTLLPLPSAALHRASLSRDVLFAKYAQTECKGSSDDACAIGPFPFLLTARSLLLALVRRRLSHARSTGAMRV